jgi:hypothetical protein
MKHDSEEYTKRPEGAPVFSAGRILWLMEGGGMSDLLHLYNTNVLLIPCSQFDVASAWYFAHRTTIFRDFFWTMVSRDSSAVCDLDTSSFKLIFVDKFSWRIREISSVFSLKTLLRAMNTFWCWRKRKSECLLYKKILFLCSFFFFFLKGLLWCGLTSIKACADLNNFIIIINPTYISQDVFDILGRAISVSWTYLLRRAGPLLMWCFKCGRKVFFEMSCTRHHLF